MANTMLSGKITKIFPGQRIQTKNGPQDKIVFDLCVSREGADERIALLQDGKKYLCDFYRCTLWGQKAVNFFKITNGQPGRIISIQGNLLQNEWVREEGPVCVNSKNPLFALIQAHGNPNMGITYDSQRNCFWIKADYVEKQVNITVHSFNFLDNPNAQPTNFGWNGNGNNNNNNSGFGVSATTNGFNDNQQANGFGGAQANTQTNGFGGTQQTNGFGGTQQTNGFGASQESQNGFGGQTNGFGGNQESGFKVDEVDVTQEVGMAGFGGASASPTGFEQAPTTTPGVSTNINSEFTPTVGAEKVAQEF